jgi:hypothetical protein
MWGQGRCGGSESTLSKYIGYIELVYEGAPLRAILKST